MEHALRDGTCNERQEVWVFWEEWNEKNTGELRTNRHQTTLKFIDQSVHLVHA